MTGHRNFRSYLDGLLPQTVKARSNRAHTGILIGRDMLVVLVATAAAFALRFDFQVPTAYRTLIFPTALGASVLFPTIFFCSGLYGYIWRYVGVDSFVRLALYTAVGTAVLSALVACTEVLSGVRVVPHSIVAFLGIASLLGFIADRSAGRVFEHVLLHTAQPERRVLIVGAGDAGSLLLRDIEGNPQLGLHVVGFLDDDTDKLGRLMRRCRVIGTIDQLVEVAQKQAVDMVFIATPSADSSTLRTILYRCGKAGIHARVVPALAAQRKSVTLDDLECVDFTTFLGREPIVIDMEPIKESIEGRTVLVTGASGSIGSELCRQVLSLRPARLILLELDESRLYETYLELCDTAKDTVIQMALADVRNAEKLTRIMDRQRIDLVIHAAAYKHVPLMEMEPDEAVCTNVMGTQNVIEACKACGIGRFLLISTDKAVTPTSVMGLTKAIAERLAFEAACEGSLHVTVVRFGNVLGSRGSVVPLLHQCLDRGEPVHITDPDVDRYFMTIPEASQLVLQAQSMSRGSDLYILDMGEPVRILDLAAAIIGQHGGEAEVHFCGLRPGEKLHEELVHDDTRLLSTDCEKVMRSDILPAASDHFGELVPQLIEAARRDDRAEMQRLMVELCPDFVGEVGELIGAG